MQLLVWFWLHDEWGERTQTSYILSAMVAPNVSNAIDFTSCDKSLVRFRKASK